MIGGAVDGRGDHPRSRGVYREARLGGDLAKGSSPLARGLPPHREDRLHEPGIIPARAGFTRSRPHLAQAARDHPRSRGVYAPRRGGSTGGVGSSPLARGLPPTPGRGSSRPGIIPARAGFTRFCRGWIGGDGDHPRSRGVYRERKESFLTRPGSSPLARGLPLGGLWDGLVARIIPARAGFTRGWAASTPPSPDHPRSRGVYRGRPRFQSAGWWIIPARAGFPRRRRGRRRSSDGSSPLARGLRERRDRRAEDQRIIPARAGFTRSAWESHPSDRDHPRSRGVYRPIR